MKTAHYKLLSALLLSITIVFSSCTSTRRMIVKENYDKAIEIAVKRIHKKPSNNKEINNLSDAYRLANQRDNDQIEFYKKSGQPDIWDEVFAIYSRLNSRQNKVKTLNASILKTIGFRDIDYDKEIAAAKLKAADYYYAHADQLLAMNDKFKARDAYREFEKVKKFYPSYKDVEQKLTESYNKGLSFVQFKVTNILSIPLPNKIQEELDKMSLGELDKFWVKYQTGDKPNGYYDYKVHLMIKGIKASPGEDDTKTWSESKEIQDGFTYALDANGNVMKDSAGNDIKIPKMKTITCYLKQVNQSKTASISGSVEMYDNSLNRMLKTIPVVGESVFANQYLEATGDQNALTDETRKKIGGKRQPFPTDIEMLFQSFEILKQTSIQAIRDNDGLIL